MLFQLNFLRVWFAIVENFLDRVCHVHTPKTYHRRTMHTGLLFFYLRFPSEAARARLKAKPHNEH